MSQQMTYLLAGNESSERLTLLLSLTKTSSEPTVNALFEHYVNGLPEERAAARFQIELSNLTRAKLRLEKVAEVVEKIKDLDWQKLKANTKGSS